jgi:hypothetical protein
MVSGAAQGFTSTRADRLGDGHRRDRGEARAARATSAAGASFPTDVANRVGSMVCPGMSGARTLRTARDDGSRAWRGTALEIEGLRNRRVTVTIPADGGPREYVQRQRHP